jgi:transcriptional regulator with XRE-family HTH domain
MDNGPDEGRCKTESQRLLRLILSEARLRGVSIRSLERTVGVGDSVFAKVLSGRVILQMRHVLLMCDGLGIEWGEFFSKAYPLNSQKADAELDQKIHRYLVRVGLLADKPAPEQKPSAEEQ